MSKTIQLHCPSTKRTIDNFVISPFQSNDQILQGIRLALQIPHAVLYTVDAKPLKLEALQDDQRILVAAARNERMLPDSPPEFEFYDGQEGDDVDPDLDAYGQTWESLSEREKCDHVMSLNELKPTTRNKLRIARQWEGVADELAEMQEKDIEVGECEGLIEQRWRMTIDHFLPEGMKPAKLKTGGKFWDKKVVAGLAVLSSLTPGQARLAMEFLEEAVQLRVTDGVETDSVIQSVDVVNAVTIIYERAGVIPMKLTKPKSAKAREKERKKALREKTKGSAKGKGKGSPVGEKE
ncbi:hypothetical protein BDU57DRAFT_458564 [Ampelomyces quisqualis]|uniref:Uncharacterized protein n=1 Tax=Ampelomyces quisqualis TaxID=50730 RepID=A0A6A5QBB8_AMPQU|nr:hypothetical protein BDU57DRAFT_458564 [Ampelomyces quisqualis]